MSLLSMMISIILWSLLPVAAIIGIKDINVWEFVFLMELVVALVSYAVVKTISIKHNVPIRSIRSYSKKQNIWAFSVGFTFALSQLCLFTSFFFLSSANSVIVYEIWPIFAMYLAPLLMGKGSTLKIRNRDMVFTVIALVGVLIVLYPEFNSELFTNNEQGSLYPYFILALPFFGSIFMALTSNLKTGFSASILDKKNPMLSMFLAQMMAKVYTIPLLGICAFLFSDGNSTYTLYGILAILFIGGVVQAIGGLLYSWSVILSKTGIVTSLWYSMPVITVFIFWVTGMSEVTEYAILGAIAIIGCNLLISVKADNSIAYVATLFTIICIGILCYLTDSFDMGEVYYDAISVPIVFFVVMGAFIMDRSISRDLLEEEWALSIINKLMAKEKKIAKENIDIIQSLCKIMKSNNSIKINDHYNNILIKGKESKALISSELDKLILSKLHSTSFGDVFITSILGLLILGVTFLFRPTGFIGDSFAIILSSSVVFMFFALVDFNNARKEFHIDIDDEGNKSISPDMVKDKRMDIIISTVIIAMVIVSFVLLLWFKYN